MLLGIYSTSSGSMLSNRWIGKYLPHLISGMSSVSSKSSGFTLLDFFCGVSTSMQTGSLVVVISHIISSSSLLTHITLFVQSFVAYSATVDKRSKFVSFNHHIQSGHSGYPVNGHCCVRISNGLLWMKYCTCFECVECLFMFTYQFASDICIY